MHGGIIIEPIYFTHEVSRIWVLRQTVGTVKFAVWKFFLQRLFICAYFILSYAVLYFGVCFMCLMFAFCHYLQV